MRKKHRSLLRAARFRRGAFCTRTIAVQNSGDNSMRESVDSDCERAGQRAHKNVDSASFIRYSRFIQNSYKACPHDFIVISSRKYGSIPGYPRCPQA